MTVKHLPFIRVRPTHNDPILTELLERRMTLDMTRKSLAERIHHWPNYVGRLEHGRNSPSLKTLQKWVEELGGKLVIEWKEEKPQEEKKK